MLCIHDMNVLSSFSLGQAHVLCNRNFHESTALRTFERDLHRLIRLVKSGSIECPLSAVGASHRNTHRNSSCCRLLAVKLT